MNWLMEKVAEAVSVIPEMHKNGPWKVERFFWTDAKMFNYIDSSGNTFYRILFNLFNPLRSDSSPPIATLQRTSVP